MVFVANALVGNVLAQFDQVSQSLPGCWEIVEQTVYFIPNPQTEGKKNHTCQ
jgi:hypothetical protein